MPDPLNFKVTSVTLTASVAQLVLNQDPSRNYLAVQNTGVGGPLTVGFGSASSAPGRGPSLDPASSAGGQGGIWEWSDAVPLNSIYLYSGLGTTATVVSG